MRWIVVVLGMIACGPQAADPNSTADGSGTSDDDDDGTGAVADTSRGDGAGVTTGVDSGSGSSSDEAADSTPIFDVGRVPQDHPPPVCEVPTRPNADVFGTTALGEVAMTAAVFAEEGGGKCPNAYRVVLAPDPAALAAEVERYGSDEVPLDVIELSLQLPDGPLEPGIWMGSVQQIRSGEVWFARAMAVDVTSVTAIDDVDAHVEATFSVVDGEFTLDGSLRAPYCATVHGGACGA